MNVYSLPWESKDHRLLLEAWQPAYMMMTSSLIGNGKHASVAVPESKVQSCECECFSHWDIDERWGDDSVDSCTLSPLHKHPHTHTHVVVTFITRCVYNFMTCNHTISISCSFTFLHATLSSTFIFGVTRVQRESVCSLGRCSRFAASSSFFFRASQIRCLWLISRIYWFSSRSSRFCLFLLQFCSVRQWYEEWILYSSTVREWRKCQSVIESQNTTLTGAQEKVRVRVKIHRHSHRHW